MKETLDEKTRQNTQMEKEINTVKTKLDARRSATTMGHGRDIQCPRAGITKNRQ